MKNHQKLLGGWLLAFGLIVLFTWSSCDPTTTGGGGDTLSGDTVKSPAGQARLNSGSADPHEVEGAPYPPARPPQRSPNEGYQLPPVPDGPVRGNLSPTNDAIQLRESPVRERPEEEGNDAPEKTAALFFKKYADLTNSQGATSTCCPELSVAENGQTIMLTGNFWMALSEDGGNTFSSLNPSTIFPQSEGGFCCDQVVQYIPEYDMFVWLIQYWRKDGKGPNRLRLAAQTTDKVRSSNGTAWTYWDFPSTVFHATSYLDRNDMSFGNQSLWWGTNVVGQGRVVARLPLEQIAAKTTINYAYTQLESDCMFGIVTQGGSNTVYWAGHKNNSTLKVYSMKDGDGFYSWRDVAIDSWPQDSMSSICSDNENWLDFAYWMHFMFGGVVDDGHVYFSWMANKGGGFPQPHSQIVKIRLSDWKKVSQFQIWNEEIAFGHPHMASNNQGELGLSVSFGGRNHFASHAVGVWGDYVVYYPKMSNRCTKRWGDYNTVRRTGQGGRDWVAGGYIMSTNSSGNPIMIPHFIRFGR